MEILQIPYSDRRGLCTLVSDYQAQVRSGIIKPVLIKELTLDGICQYDTFIAAQDNGVFLGILHYEFISRINLEYWKRMFHAHFNGTLWIPNEDNPPLSKILKIDGFKKYIGMGSLLFIRQMESFKRHAGIGTKLLAIVKGLEDTEGIFLESLYEDSTRFYENNGFNRTGLAVKKKGNGAILKVKPVMIWMKSGEY